MKRKDLTDYRGKKEVELAKIIADKKTELDLTRAKAKIGKEKNTSKLKVIKRDIAQILTILREKKIIEEEAK
jgi:ribosomal protein L29